MPAPTVAEHAVCQYWISLSTRNPTRTPCHYYPCPSSTPDITPQSTAPPFYSATSPSKYPIPSSIYQTRTSVRNEPLLPNAPGFNQRRWTLQSLGFNRLEKLEEDAGWSAPHLDFWPEGACA
eukprot:822867-Rhodomonas_salina.2